MDVLLYLEDLNPLRTRAIAITNQKGASEKLLFFLCPMIYQSVFRKKVGI